MEPIHWRCCPCEEKSCVHQRQKYVGSAEALLPGKFLRDQEFFALNFCLLYPDLVWKITEVSGKFPDYLESFQIVLNVSELSGKYRKSRKLPNFLTSYQIVWKVTRISGKFPDNL